ncbi:MAG: hypothetical protein LBD89_00570 [Tannerellaceae bacterium]|jgi:hypothetical protein|nr:hypothetical protein [Tannerellaceae bacterium]
MDNLGDWLYIILLVVAGIGGVLNSGKKKKREESREILREPDYEMDPEYSNSEEIFPPKSAKAKKERKIPKTTQTYIPLFGEGERTVTTPDLSSESSPDNENQGISGETFHDKEELKKAIIYSEILHRKY